MIFKCFENQTYPKQLMEWIIIDDGEDIHGEGVKPLFVPVALLRKIAPVHGDYADAEPHNWDLSRRW